MKRVSEDSVQDKSETQTFSSGKRARFFSSSSSTTSETMLSEPTSDVDTSVYPHWPDFAVADLMFNCIRNSKDTIGRDKLVKQINSNSMAQLNNQCNNKIENWPIQLDLQQRMETENTDKTAELDKAIKDAEDNLGVTEIRSAIMAKIQFLCKIGDFTNAISLIEESSPKKALSTLNSKLDLKFYHIRCLLFDLKNVRELCRVTTEAKKILENSGSADWDRKNRLKVYEGLVSFHAKRDFASAIKLFLEVLPTYNCYEILDHKTFITYTVLFGMISLQRPQLRDQIVKNSEIRQVLFNEPDVREFLNSLFECRYMQFFRSLSQIEERLKQSRLWFPHFRYYVSELKIIAYNQHLESYNSLSLQSMADSFGISAEMIDQDLSRLISTGRINCKIDKVNGHINDLRPDEKNIQYQELLKKGDLLLTRIQKLSRVISL
ncbi:hypothetical protein GJ496_005144 [Pomphorhynchus laevis]|nr:hypothetical protein GJ496_005144 [Pomphorhynchus laevis]